MPQANRAPATRRWPWWLWLVAAPLVLFGLAWVVLAVLLPPAPALDLDVREFRVAGGHVLLDDLGASRRITAALETRMSLTAERGGERVATGGETVLKDLAFGPLSAARLRDLDQGLARLEWHVRHRAKF